MRLAVRRKICHNDSFELSKRRGILCAERKDLNDEHWSTHNPFISSVVVMLLL